MDWNSQIFVSSKVSILFEADINVSSGLAFSTLLRMLAGIRYSIASDALQSG